ncbi:MAG: tail protein X [Hyphomicrobiales bacterium]|nr:tail protein X [Hyphomicrobiales bacterium]
MTTFVSYTTKPGDRWDLIAYRMYGDATRYGPIVDANRAFYVRDPLVSILAVLPPGLTLKIPVLDPPAAANGPPWRAQP